MSENDPVEDDAEGEQQSETPDAEGNASESETDAESTDSDQSESEPESETAPPEQLIQSVEENAPAEVAREIESLREQIGEKETTIEELESSLKRKQADFQNYKKRMKKRREQERKRATEDLITRLVDVRDNLKRGIEQDGDIREGIETTLNQFDRVLEQESVSEIAPEPGEEVDPQRHEVLMRVDSEQPADTIDDVHRPGYEMADKIIREAQVTVSDGNRHEES